MLLPWTGNMKHLEDLRKILKNAEIAHSVSCNRGDPKHVTDAWYDLVLRAHSRYETARQEAAKEK